MARVKAVLRRGKAQSPPTDAALTQPVLQIGPLIVDPARREVKLDGKLIELRTQEFDLLQTFVENKGLALSREKLLELAWGFDFYGETRTVDVHVAHLRDWLGHDSRLKIETIWGVGYKLVEE